MNIADKLICVSAAGRTVCNDAVRLVFWWT